MGADENLVLRINAILANPFHDCGLDERELKIVEWRLVNQPMDEIAEVLGISRRQAYNILDAALQKIGKVVGEPMTADALTAYVLGRIRAELLA